MINGTCKDKKPESSSSREDMAHSPTYTFNKVVAGSVSISHRSTSRRYKTRTNHGPVSLLSIVGEDYFQPAIQKLRINSSNKKQDSTFTQLSYTVNNMIVYGLCYMSEMHLNSLNTIIIRKLLLITM